jgi:di/tricarboxylate transporter
MGLSSPSSIAVGAATAVVVANLVQIPPATYVAGSRSSASPGRPPAVPDRACVASYSGAVDGLTSDMVLVLVILAGTVVLFVTEIVRIDVAAIGVMVVVGLTELVPADEVFDGFASNAVISIIAVMILGRGLDRVGVMRSVAAWLLRVGGDTERRVLVSVSATVGTISAFLQNIGAAALFLPVVERVAERTGLAVSRLLMPMGFAAILGGTLTLVASGPLILLNDLLASSAQTSARTSRSTACSPHPDRAGILASGIALFALAGRWLLPAVSAGRGSAAVLPDVESTYGLDRDLRPAWVPQGSPLLDDTIGGIEARSGHVRVVAVSDHEGVALGRPAISASPPTPPSASSGPTTRSTASSSSTDCDAARRIRSPSSTTTSTPASPRSSSGPARRQWGDGSRTCGCGTNTAWSCSPCTTGAR